MPPDIHGIPPNTKDLIAYSTPVFNTLSPLFLQLLSLIFKSSKAEVARSNRAGQARSWQFQLIRLAICTIKLRIKVGNVKVDLYCLLYINTFNK